jgi:hypothetical protein
MNRPGRCTAERRQICLEWQSSRLSGLCLCTAEHAKLRGGYRHGRSAEEVATIVVD